MASAQTFQTLQLREGVALVGRADQQHLLVSRDGSAVKVSPLTAELMPLLTRGTTLEELVAAIQLKYPRANQVEVKLSSFVEILGRSGLLIHRNAARERHGKRYTFDIDRSAFATARALNAVPRPLLWFGLILLALLSLASIAELFYSGFRLRPEMVLWLFHPMGILCVLLLVVPAHEFAHAVVCRAAGSPVRAAGIILFARFWPVPFVDTSCAYALPGRLSRAAIAAAGPFIDLLTCGASAWFLLPVHHQFAVVGAARALFLISLSLLFFDTTLFTPSDGSHVLEALLNDELARHDALRKLATNARASLQKYRVACVVHAVFALLLFWLFTH